MKYNKKKLIFITAILLIYSIFGFIDTDKVFAQDAVDSTKVDVVFVIDASKSMKTSDPEGLTGEAMKMFIDMSHSTGDKGGMVAYSDKIVREYMLKPLNSEADKSLLKSTLTGLELGNWTDIGFGLKRAVSILKDGQNKNNRPIIILLSDGKNDPQRDKKASQDDLAAALNEAKAQQFPVYTIGLNADGTVDKNQLESISKETNAKNFITNNAEELPRILREIFADNSKLKILQENTIIGNNQFQDVKISIPDSNISEANISILSSKSVEIKLIDSNGHAVNIPSEKILYTTSNHYSLVKIISPEKGDWLLSVKGSRGDKMDISLISNYDLKAGFKINLDGNYHKGDKVELAAYVESNGINLGDMDFYSTLKSTAFVNNLANGETKEVPMKLLGNSFTGEFTIPEDTKYDIRVKIEGPGFIRETETKNIIAENTIPIDAKKIKDLLLWNKKVMEINLSDYFTDSNNDSLTYSVSSKDINPSGLKISGNTLIIQGEKWGTNTITITAEDGKGEKASTNLTVKIYPISYIAISAIAVIILTAIAVSIEYLFKRKSKVTALTGNGTTLGKLGRSGLRDSHLDQNQAAPSKISILKEIDESRAIYERKICEKIAGLSEAERNELLNGLKKLYLDAKKNFHKASYLTYNYINLRDDNFDIIQVLRDSATDYDSMDNLIKHILSDKGLAGVVSYLNHLSRYQEDYGLESSYFEKVLSLLISEYSLAENPAFRKLSKELAKVAKNISEAKVMAQNNKTPEVY